MEEFRRQCQRVKEMEFRVVEILDDKVAAVFEVLRGDDLEDLKLLGNKLNSIHPGVPISPTRPIGRDLIGPAGS
jgi:hypothetical protein